VRFEVVVAALTEDSGLPGREAFRMSEDILKELIVFILIV
jgi:hypothetical protein